MNKYFLLNIEDRKNEDERNGTHLSVNFWKLFRAKNSSEGQFEPIANKASSVALMHCNFKTFSAGHWEATDSIPLFLIISESNDKTSRDGQWDPTASRDISVIHVQAATPRVFIDLPHPRTRPIKPLSVNPSQKRKFSSSSFLQ